MRGRPRKNIVPYDKHESVVFDYMARKTAIHTLANQYNVTTYVIREILADANVPIRPRGQPRKETAFEYNARKAAYEAANVDDNLTKPLGE